MMSKFDESNGQVEEIESKQQSVLEGTSESHVDGNAQIINSQGVVRNIPVPSADPNDPLNYSTWMKAGIIVSCCWFSVMSLSLIGGLGSILGVFFQLYIPQGKTQQEVLWLSTLPSLIVGLGNYLILPFALCFGRRPAFLIAAVVLVAATIGAAASNSFEGHLAARIIQGLATGSTESLLPLMLSEITFIHQRSLVFGCYWTTQNLFSSALNIASSYEAAALTWRWYYGIYAITAGIGLIIGILFAFETRFDRPAASIDGVIVYQDEFGVTRFLEQEDVGADFLYDGQENAANNPKKTYLQNLNPWPGKTKNGYRIAVMSWVNMVKSCTSPGILYSILLTSITLGITIAMSLTYNTILAEQYHWKAADIGLINVGAIPASLLAMLYAGFLGDKFNLWMAKRNNNIHQPEHRLIPLIFPCLVALGATLLYGFTATDGKSWWGIYMGWTLYQFAFVSVLIISTTFATEVSPKNPGPALVMVVGTKNIISFGASYGLVPMVNLRGYAWAYGTLAGVFAGVAVLGVPVYFLNPVWRRYTSAKK